MSLRHLGVSAASCSLWAGADGARTTGPFHTFLQGGARPASGCSHVARALAGCTCAEPAADVPRVGGVRAAAHPRADVSVRWEFPMLPLRSVLAAGRLRHAVSMPGPCSLRTPGQPSPSGAHCCPPLVHAPQRPLGDSHVSSSAPKRSPLRKQLCRLTWGPSPRCRSVCAQHARSDRQTRRFAAGATTSTTK